MGYENFTTAVYLMYVTPQYNKMISINTFRCSVVDNTFLPFYFTFTLIVIGQFPNKSIDAQWKRHG